MVPTPGRCAMNDAAGAHYDVAIVGGSFAGLTAALQLGRASRRTVVLDAGAPRNRFSPAAHGVPGWDGTPPGEILDRFRADLAVYPSVHVQSAHVAGVSGSLDAFTLDCDDDEPITCRRIILAHGVDDVLPDVAGLAEGWGRTVLHCPYCHGYEVRGRRLAVLATHPMSAHQAHLLRADWSDNVTFLTSGLEDVDASALAGADIAVDGRDLVAVRSEGDGLVLCFADGDTTDVAALFLSPRASIAGTPAAQLGCTFAEGPMGPFVQVGDMGQTSVPGVFAAGDLARPMPNVNLAVADGTVAGASCHQSLVFPGAIQWPA